MSRRKLCGTRVANVYVVSPQRRDVRHKDRLVEKETSFTATLPHGPVVSVRLVVWNVRELWCMRLLDAHNTHLLGQKNRGETMEGMVD